MAGDLSALIVDLGGPTDQQVVRAGELAIGVGQAAEQVEGDSNIASDAAGAVVQVSAGEVERLRWAVST